MRSKISSKLFSTINKNNTNTNTNSIVNNLVIKNFSLGIDINLTDLTTNNYTFKDLDSQIQKQRKFESSSYLTWDYSNIAKSNNISTVLNSNEPIFVKLDRLECIELTNNVLNNNDNLLDLNKEQVDPKTQLKIDSLKNHFNSNIEDLDNIILSEANNNNKDNNFSQLHSKLLSLKKEYLEIYEKENLLTKSAEKKSLFIIFLGGILFIIELILLYIGTFIWYSWDLTEPMTYLVTCANLALVFYIKKKTKNVSPHVFFTEFFMKNKTNKVKLDEYKRMIGKLERNIHI